MQFLHTVKHFWIVSYRIVSRYFVWYCNVSYRVPYGCIVPSLIATPTKQTCKVKHSGFQFIYRIYFSRRKYGKFRVQHSFLTEHWNNGMPGLKLLLCDTRDTSILIVDTYAAIPVSPRSRYTAVYRCSTKYRRTAQVSRISSIPCSSYHLAFSNVNTTSL